MALSLEISTTDRFDQEYVAGRQTADQQALDAWWSHQLTPQAPGQPPGTATGTTPKPSGSGIGKAIGEATGLTDVGPIATVRTMFGAPPQPEHPVLASLQEMADNFLKISNIPPHLMAQGLRAYWRYTNEKLGMGPEITPAQDFLAGLTEMGAGFILPATPSLGGVSQTAQTVNQIAQKFVGNIDVFGPMAKQIRASKGLLMSEQGSVKLPGGKDLPSVGEVAVSDLKLDPQRFQYKVQQAEGGATGSLAGVKAFDPNLSGIIQVWRDPANGQTYVVNGHNRVALAKQTGAPSIAVRYIQADTAEEARSIGAMTNIAEGRGNAIDAAKFFRDTGLTRQDLEARGLPMREKVAADGLALANLQDSLFNDVIQGQLPVERGIIIGSRIADPDQQLKLVALLRAEAAKGRRIGNEQVRELADFVQSAPTTKATQETLFGAEETTVSLALDKARIAAAIRERLSTDKALFSRVGKESSAQRLTEAGNIINVEESQRLAQQSASLLEIFDRLKNSTGEISDILNDAATRLQAGESFDAVRRSTYDRLSQALPEAITKAESEPAGRAATGGGVAELTTSSGDILSAEAERTRGGVSEAGVPIREAPPEPQAIALFEQPPAAAAPEAAPTPIPAPGTAEAPPTGPRENLTTGLTGQPEFLIDPHLNLRHFALDAKSLAILENISRYGEATGTAEAMRRGVVGHAETLAASKGAVSIEELLARQLGTMANNRPINEQVASARQMMANAASYMADLGARVKAGDQDAIDLYRDAFVVSGEVIDSAKGLVSEVARGLNAAAIETTPELTQAVLEGLQAARGSLGAQALQDIPVERLVAMVESTPPAKRPDLLRAGLRNMLYEVWINNLLTGPQTHMANIASNTLTALWSIPVRGLATRRFAQEAEGVVSGEATALMYGAVEGFKDALQAGAMAVRTGQESFGGLSKLEGRPAAISAETLGLTGHLGYAVDLLGTAIRLPGRLLMSADEFFKTINFRMELRAQALRQATREGLEGEALGRRVADIVAHPEDYPTIKNAAENFAFYQTFNQELGGIGSSLMNLRNAIPGGGLILPFVRTPTNITKYSFEHMPGLNLAMKSVRDDLRAGGARRDLAMAKTAMGGMVMGVVAAMAAEGLITGGGPSDPTLNKLWRIDHQPYSVRFPGGSTWYSYNRLDPIGTLFGTAANITDMSAQIPDADYLQLATAAGIAAGETMLSKTYLRGIGEAIDVLRQPEEKGRQFVANWSRSLVPTIVAQAERAMTPTQSLTNPPTDIAGAGYDQETGKLLWKEVNGILSNMVARVPGLSEALPPTRNLYGEPVLLGAGQWYELINPVYTQAVRDDPATQEIEQHRVRLSMPSKYLYGQSESASPFVNPGSVGEGVPLTAKEYDEYVKLAGNELKLNFQGQKLGMHDALNALVASPGYQRLTDGPDGSKADRIRGVVMNYREAARAYMLTHNNDLKELVKRRMQERGEAKRPQAGHAVDWRETLGIAR